MSMLSLQIDNLRLMARLVRDYDYDEISRMLREAAYTIESLRERLQDRRGECFYIPDYQGFTWWDENDEEHYEEYSASDECWSASCNECGNTMIVGDEGWFKGWDEIKEWTEEGSDKLHKGYVLEPTFNFCPNCGKSVKR